MASVVIPRKYSTGNPYLLLPKAITFFCDVPFEPCNHGSVETLLCRRLQVVDQLQQVTKCAFTVIQFSTSSSVNMLPPTEMEERWECSSGESAHVASSLPALPFPASGGNDEKSSSNTICVWGKSGKG